MTISSRSSDGIPSVDPSLINPDPVHHPGEQVHFFHCNKHELETLRKDVGGRFDFWLTLSLSAGVAALPGGFDFLYNLFFSPELTIPKEGGMSGLIVVVGFFMAGIFQYFWRRQRNEREDLIDLILQREGVAFAKSSNRGASSYSAPQGYYPIHPSDRGRIIGDSINDETKLFPEVLLRRKSVADVPAVDPDKDSE